MKKADEKMVEQHIYLVDRSSGNRPPDPHIYHERMATIHIRSNYVDIMVLCNREHIRICNELIYIYVCKNEIQCLNEGREPDMLVQ